MTFNNLYYCTAKDVKIKYPVSLTEEGHKKWIDMTMMGMHCIGLINLYARKGEEKL